MMVEEQTQEQEAEEILTPEQILQRKTEMMAFWKEQESFLTAQRDNQRLITEIEELRTRAVMAQVQMHKVIESTKADPENQPGRSLKKEPK